MTTTQRSYCEGLSLGHEYAEVDRREWASQASAEAELRLEAEQARGESDSWRAFRLGIVRGYREAARTFQRGRWGL